MILLNNNDAYSLTSPHPYCLVTSLDKENKPNALAVSWVTRTSISPFLMLISIDRRRYSHEGIDHHKEFVINFPNQNQSEAAIICGTKSGRNVDKIKESKLILIDSTSVKVPTIDDSTVSFECKVIDQYTTGDHTIFIGEVLAATGNPDKSKHLFSATKPSIISIDQNGNINMVE